MTDRCDDCRRPEELCECPPSVEQAVTAAKVRAELDRPRPMSATDALAAARAAIRKKKP